MDIYDKITKRLGKLNQKKLLIGTIIGASILIVLIIGFIVYVQKSASQKKHLLDPSGSATKKRLEEELNRQEKILEDPELKEIYEKVFVNKDLSI